MKDYNMNIDNYGQVSIQRDGGINKSRELVEKYFNDKKSELDIYTREDAKVSGYGIGIFTNSNVPDVINDLLVKATKLFGENEMYVVTTEKSTHLTEKYNEEIFKTKKIETTCLHGYNIPTEERKNKYHIMESLTNSWIENITAICSGGVNILLAYNNIAIPGHPFVPMLKLSDNIEDKDADIIITKDTSVDELIALIIESLNDKYKCKSIKENNISFQICRTDTGVSL